MQSISASLASWRDSHKALLQAYERGEDLGINGWSDAWTLTDYRYWVPQKSNGMFHTKAEQHLIGVLAVAKVLRLNPLR